jgi:DNA-binding transcriptional regulator YiaG
MDTTQAERIKQTMQRLKLDKTGMARYMGVPHGTVSGWIDGIREPSASAIRLLDVLGTLEVIAPAIHASFIPSAPADKRFK